MTIKGVKISIDDNISTNVKPLLEEEKNRILRIRLTKYLDKKKFKQQLKT